MSPAQKDAARRLAGVAADAALNVTSVAAVLAMASGSGDRDDLASATVCAEIALARVSEMLSGLEAALYKDDLGTTS